MTHLGTLEGEGHLVIENTDTAPIRYTINVWRDGSGMKTAGGQIMADYHVLIRAFNKRQFEIRLDNGSSVHAFIDYYQPPEASADIQITGPVPGF